MCWVVEGGVTTRRGYMCLSRHFFYFELHCQKVDLSLGFLTRSGANLFYIHSPRRLFCVKACLHFKFRVSRSSTGENLNHYHNISYQLQGSKKGSDKAFLSPITYYMYIYIINNIYPRQFYLLNKKKFKI